MGRRGTSETQNVLWRIDAETNEARPLPNTTGAGWPAVGEGFAWVTVCRGPEASGCPESTAVLKLDSTTGETLETIALPGYGWQITIGFGSVWVSTSEGLVRIAAATGEVASTIPGDFNLLAAAGPWLWATRRWWRRPDMSGRLPAAGDSPLIARMCCPA